MHEHVTVHPSNIFKLYTIPGVLRVFYYNSSAKLTSTCWPLYWDMSRISTRILSMHLELEHVKMTAFYDPDCVTACIRTSCKMNKIWLNHGTLNAWAGKLAIHLHLNWSFWWMPHLKEVWRSCVLNLFCSPGTHSGVPYPASNEHQYARKLTNWQVFYIIRQKLFQLCYLWKIPNQA